MICTGIVFKSSVTLAYRSRLSFPGRRASASLINLVATNLVFKGTLFRPGPSIHLYRQTFSYLRFRNMLAFCTPTTKQWDDRRSWFDDTHIYIKRGARFFYIWYWRSIGFPRTLKSALPDWIGKNRGKIYTQIPRCWRMEEMEYEHWEIYSVLGCTYTYG